MRALFGRWSQSKPLPTASTCSCTSRLVLLRDRRSIPLALRLRGIGTLTLKGRGIGTHLVFHVGDGALGVADVCDVTHVAWGGHGRLHGEDNVSNNVCVCQAATFDEGQDVVDDLRLLPASRMGQRNAKCSSMQAHDVTRAGNAPACWGRGGGGWSGCCRW